MNSDDVLTELSGLDEAKTVVDQLARRSVSLLFTCSEDWRFAVAEKVFAIGPAVVPELEKRIEEGGDPRATVHAALILLKHGSQKGVDQLLQFLKDGVGPAGAIAFSLAKARVPGVADSIRDALLRLPIRKDYPYQAVPFIDALRILDLAIPAEVGERLKKIAPAHWKALNL